jgi:hypothetical protein
MASFIGLAFMLFLPEFLWQTIAIAHQRSILKIPKPSGGHIFRPRIILTCPIILSRDPVPLSEKAYKTGLFYYFTYLKVDVLRRLTT